MTIIASRRGFITGLGAALIAAPAIVRVASIMPVKQMLWSDDDIARLLDARLDAFDGKNEQQTFVRYCVYEGPYFDAGPRQWISYDEIMRRYPTMTVDQFSDGLDA